MKSLKTFFTITILICLIISVSLASYISTSVSIKAIEVESKKLLESEVVKSATELETKVVFFETKLETLSSVIENNFNIRSIPQILEGFELLMLDLTDNENIIASYLVFNPEQIPYTENNEYPYQLLFIKNQDNIIERSYNIANQNDFKSDEDYMAWFNQPKNSKQGVWSNIYYDKFLNTEIITYSHPIIVDGNVIAILGVDIKFSDFEQLITSISVYETGYAFLMNESFDYLIHPTLTREENLKTIFDGKYEYMANKFDSKQTGIIKYNFENKDKIMAFTRLSNNWILAVAPPIKEVFSTYYDLGIKQIYFIGIGLLISLFIALIVGEYISRPLKELSKGIEHMTYSNLEVKLPNKNMYKVFEIQALYKNFTKLQLNLKEAFLQINDNNINLEKLVTVRTKELETSNEKLIKSLNTLETTQDKLIEAKKEEELNIIIKNIVNSINTPLGNTITTFSYLESLFPKMVDDFTLTDKKFSLIKKSFGIINNSNNNLRNIIDGLNILTSDFNTENETEFNLKNTIESRYLWIKSKHTDMDLNINLNCDEDSTITVNKNMFVKMLDTLFLNSIFEYFNNTTSSLNIDLTIKNNDNILTIQYSDHLKSFNSMKKIINPEDSTTLNISKLSLDLNILHVIITKGVKGTLHIKKIDSQDFEWFIGISKKNKN